MSSWQIHPQSVLRPESEGALWFQKRSAQTLELDAEGLKALEQILSGKLAGSVFWRLRCWNLQNFLVARGFLLSAHEVHAESLAQLARCLLPLEAPLRSRLAPEVLHLSLTDACHQSCSGCFFSNRQPGLLANRYLELQLYRQIVAVAAANQVFQLALGGGEPLMHPELEQMVQLASAAGLVVNLTSSGTLLTAQGAQALKQSGLGQLQLSLNGSQAELHQRTRPGFEQVRRAMAFCRQARLRFGLNILVMRQNLSDLEAILALAQQEGAWSVNLLRPKAALDQPAETASAWLEQALPTADENRYLQGILKRWQRKARFLLQTDTSLTFLRQGKARAFVRSGLGGCSAGRRMLSIQVDGRVAPCSHIALTDELPLSGDFMQIWQSSRHLERFRQLEETLSGACGSCELKSVCRGCRAIAWQQSGDFNAEDQQCPKRLSILS